MKNKNSESERHSLKRHSRREFIRKAAYATPVVLTLSAAPSFAQQGSAGGSGSGDTGGGDPGGGPRRTIDDVNCDEPLQPIDSDVAVSICNFSEDEQGFFFEDIIVSPDAVPGYLAEGDLLGTCDAFFCSVS